MYEPHESLPFPKGKGVQLWRYMDFTKYVSMLESSCLFFCRADNLGDPYESSMPVGMVKKYVAEIEKQTKENSEESLARAKILQHNLKFFYHWSRIAAISMYINCWHMNKHESDAMWKVYLTGSEGVAVLSSPGRLVKSIEANDERISIGKVVYADYEKLDLHHKGGFNLLDFISRKRVSFRHETEIRAVIWKSQSATADEEGWIDAPTGFQVPVDLHQLIRAVYVSPSSPPWFQGLVKAINERYGIKAEVRLSRMAQGPLRLVTGDSQEELPTKGITKYRFDRPSTEDMPSSDQQGLGSDE